MSPYSEERLAKFPLRERKKRRTQIAIQSEALRLFREQGYEATTIEQICAGAEVSMSTFFRYFASKQEVVISDVLDPLALAAFQSQPSEISPIEALRRAIKEVFGNLSAEELAEEHQRQTLIRATPELQAGWLGSTLANTLDVTVATIASRAGRAPDDIAVVTLAGALLGVCVAVWLRYPSATTSEYIELLDAGIARLETGPSLGCGP